MQELCSQNVRDLNILHRNISSAPLPLGLIMDMGYTLQVG